MQNNSVSKPYSEPVVNNLHCKSKENMKKNEKLNKKGKKMK